MKPSWLLLAPLALCLAGSIPASAGILDYTETFTGSGTFNGTAFSNEAVTLSLIGDTANISSSGQSPNVWFLSGAFTVTVNGLGSTLFTSDGGVVINNGQGGVFAGEIGTSIDPNAPAFFGIFNPAFGSYDLSTTFGPVTDSGGAFGTGGSTANGSLDLSDFGTVTFAVTDDNPITVTPEPSSLILLGTGVLGIAGMLRRRLVA